MKNESVFILLFPTFYRVATIPVFPRKRPRITAELEVLPDLCAMLCGRGSFVETVQPITSPSSNTFVFETFFLRKLIAALTIDKNEQLYFLTGPKVGSTRIVCRWAECFPLAKQSTVSAAASARSVADALIPIIEQGSELHVVAHSHPGRGAGATYPSHIDINCASQLEKSGSPAIGCIVTRDGYIRFFSASTRFEVKVVGAGFTQVERVVFYVAHQN